MKLEAELKMVAVDPKLVVKNFPYLSYQIYIF